MVASFAFITKPKIEGAIMCGWIVAGILVLIFLYIALRVMIGGWNA